MKSTALDISTCLGTLRLTINAGRPITSEDKLIVTAFDLEAKLPPTMAVDSSKAVYIEITPELELSNLAIEFVFPELLLVGSPETGEALDAQSWESDTHVVMIGTEDTEFLSRRLPSLDLSEREPPTEFLPNGFRIALPKLRPKIPVSFHFVVASNPLPEPEECSAWFAVDVPHARIEENAKKDNKAEMATPRKPSD